MALEDLDALVVADNQIADANENHAVGKLVSRFGITRGRKPSPRAAGIRGNDPSGTAGYDQKEDANCILIAVADAIAN